MAIYKGYTAKLDECMYKDIKIIYNTVFLSH